MNKAAITGCNGQVASYLCELLLEKGYEVYGLIRRSSVFTTERIDHLFDHPNLHLRYGDLADTLSIVNFITEAKPDIFLHQGAQSHVKVSFEIPEYTLDIDATGTIRCLEAIRKYSPKTKFLQASSSELFGSTPPPQNEETPFHPRSPYACAKLAAYWATINYRERGLWAANAITFNMESPRRLETFVTRKITRAATKIKMGLQNNLVLGNLSAKRDWSHCKDSCRAMLLMLEADEPKDYVISSGESHSVEEFCEIVFSKIGLNYKDYVITDDRYKRPTEVEHLLGDSTKIRNDLGWKPQYSFEQLVDEMVQYDLNIARDEKLVLDSK